MPYFNLYFFFMWKVESAPFSWMSSYSAHLAARHHFWLDRLRLARSLIQHVAQLKLPASKCSFFSSASMTSKISSGNFLNPVPGTGGLYLTPNAGPRGFVGLNGPLDSRCGVIKVVYTCGLPWPLGPCRRIGTIGSVKERFAPGPKV